MRRDLRRWLLLLFPLALVVRLIVAVYFSTATTWEQHSYGGELGQIAANLAEGLGFSSPLQRGSQPSAWVAPLVPAVWAGVFRGFGIFSQVSFLVILLSNAIFSALAWLVYSDIAARLWPVSPKAVAPFVVLSSVLLVWPPGLTAIGETWYFSSQELVTALMVWLLVSWRLPWSLWRSVVVGLVGICLAYINPLPLIVLLGALAREVWENRSRLFRKIPSTAIALVVIAVGMLPWMIRNYQQLGGIVLMRSNFGVELRQGNNPEGSIRQTAQSVHPTLQAEEHARFNTMGEYAYGQWATTQALQYMTANPAVTLRRIVQRAYVFWCSDVFDQWTWTPREKWWRQGIRTLIVTSGRLVVHNLPWLVALLVVLLGWRSYVGARWVFASIVLLFPVPYYLTHVAPRYSYLVQPYLLIFAAVAVAFGLVTTRQSQISTQCS